MALIEICHNLSSPDIRGKCNIAKLYTLKYLIQHKYHMNKYTVLEPLTCRSFHSCSVTIHCVISVNFQTHCQQCTRGFCSEHVLVWYSRVVRIYSYLNSNQLSNKGRNININKDIYKVQVFYEWELIFKCPGQEMRYKIYIHSSDSVYTVFEAKLWFSFINTVKIINHLPIWYFTFLDQILWRKF